MDYLLIIMAATTMLAASVGLAVMEYMKRQEIKYGEDLSKASRSGKDELATYLRRRLYGESDEAATIDDIKIISQAYFRLWKARRNTESIINSSGDVERRFRRDFLIAFTSLFAVSCIAYITLGIVLGHPDFILVVGLFLASAALCLRICFIYRQMGKIEEDCLRVLSEATQEANHAL